MDIPYWSESEWLRRLIRRAREYAVCDADAEDFAHACVCAFRRHFQIFPWESSNPLLAWRWCCQKLRSLSMDYARRTARCPQVAFSDLAEDAIVAEVEKETLETLSVEEFLSALPRVQREALQLRLEGYSWEETAQILGKPSSTLRSYLPSLKAKFREFFGYDPSNQPSQSLISVEGRESPHPVLVGQNDEHSKTDATDTDASSKTRGGGGAAF